MHVRARLGKITNDRTPHARFQQQKPEEAATKIQKVWRGRRDRCYFERRRNCTQPWGYYTHTLGLVYASMVKRSRVSSRKVLWQLIEEPNSSDAAFIVAVTIVGAILLSILVFMLETLPEVGHSLKTFWMILELLCTLVFMAEYPCRWTACKEGNQTRCQFFFAPMNLLDLVAILPFWFDVIVGPVGLHKTLLLGKMARMVRLVRLLRIFKLGRYTSGVQLMVEALQQSSQALAVMAFLLFMCIIISSSAVYTMEKVYCPRISTMSAADLNDYATECADNYNRGVSPTYGLCCTEDSAPLDFPNMIAACWMSMSAMTSVGYGDIYPRTHLGKGCCSVAMLMGMILMALPIAIIGQQFQNAYEMRDMQDAKHRLQSQLRTNGEVWSLIPGSNVIDRLKKVEIKDPALAHSVAALSTKLEEVWEQREKVSRARQLDSQMREANVEKTTELLGALLSVSTTW